MDDRLYIITGPNGGGKSTLFRVLSGVWRVRNIRVHGEAETFGDDPLKGPLRNVGIGFQEHFRHYLGSTPESEVLLRLRSSGIKGKEAEMRCQEVLKEWDLWEMRNRSMSALSDGEKLRVILASLFALKPVGYLLDEPLSSLDPLRAERVVKLIKSLDAPALVFEHRREFFGKAHVAIVGGNLVKPRPRKPIVIESRRDGKRMSLKLFKHSVEVPLAVRGIIPIRGPNGAGKTTLLRRLFKALRKRLRVVYVPSDPGLSLHGPRAEDEANRIFKGPLWALSFGQRKELSVVAGLQREADLYLLDEPFKGLDDDARERILNLIRSKAVHAGVYIATNERESIHIKGPELRIEGGEVIEKSGASGT